MAASASTRSLNIFIGYHAIDEPLKARLMKHLRVLQRLYNISIDHEIQPGSAIYETVEKQLHAADMILLLLTGDFLGSDNHMRDIIEPAIKRSKASESVVVSVIMRSCLWKATQLADMMVLPESGEALEEWTVPEMGYRNVANDLKNRIEQFKAALEMQELKNENERLKEENAALKKKQ